MSCTTVTDSNRRRNRGISRIIGEGRSVGWVGEIWVVLKRDRLGDALEDLSPAFARRMDP
jgi:hypothetical protein